MAITDNFCSMMQLANVAVIQPGYLSRTSVESVPSGTHWLLQAKDVTLQHGLRFENAARFEPERNPDLYRVSRGDILLVARGQNHRVCLIDVCLTNVLASSVFYIIRPREGIVPGYLAWWLNQPDAQAILESASSGAVIGYIARSVVECIPVAVPPLDVQHRIVETLDLWRQQQSAQERLDQKREQLIQTICRQAVGLKKE